VPSYYTVVRNKWVDVAISVPEMEQAIFTNQATIKYHIMIPASYWPTKYKDWDNRTEKEQLALFTGELNEMNTWLTTNENAGKSFVSHYGVDPRNNKEIPGFKIEAVDNKLKEGAFIPSSDKANREIQFAMASDPVLSGDASSGSEGGSGSGKRLAAKLQSSLFRRDRDVSLRLFNFIKAFNGWPKDVYADFMDDQDPNISLPQNQITPKERT